MLWLGWAADQCLLVNSERRLFSCHNKFIFCRLIVLFDSFKSLLTNEMPDIGR